MRVSLMRLFPAPHFNPLPCLRVPLLLQQQGVMVMFTFMEMSTFMDPQVLDRERRPSKVSSLQSLVVSGLLLLLLLLDLLSSLLNHLLHLLFLLSPLILSVPAPPQGPRTGPQPWIPEAPWCVGRDALLQLIASELGLTSPDGPPARDQCPVSILHGTGGMGKTTVAARLAKRMSQEQRTRTVCWMRAGQQDLDAETVRLAEWLGCAPQQAMSVLSGTTQPASSGSSASMDHTQAMEEIRASVRAHLSAPLPEGELPVLLIIDQADASQQQAASEVAASLQKVLPRPGDGRGRGRVVITTQLSGLKAELRRLLGSGLQCQEHKLHSLPGSAAVELMQDLLAHSPAAQLAGTLLAKLAECLGGYPLALHQASGLLSRCQDLSTPSGH